ncbi:hypothetical protein [Pseudomonas sp. PB3P13]
MKDATSPPFSPIQITVNTNDMIGNTSIASAIDRNYGILDDHFFKPILGDEELIKLLKDIRAVINDPALQADLETRWSLEDSQQGNKFNTLLRDARYAYLYLELAKSAEIHNDRDRAWAFTCYASVMVGEISEKSAAIIDKMNKDARSIQNSKNAKAKDKSYLLAKEEVARLLEHLKPAGGWISFRGAAIALEKDMIKFLLETRPPNLTASNICNLLEKEWLPKDELVNTAWTKTAAVEIHE